MRIADPVELKPDQSIESVLTAVMPRFVVESLSNALRDVDQYEAPGPAKMAVIRLDMGSLVVVVYHEMKNLLEILAPLDGAVEKALAEVVAVLRIPRTSVEWVREGIALSRVYDEAGEMTHESSIDRLPPARGRNRFWRVAASSLFAQRPVAASESISLTLLIMRLMHSAGDIEPIDDTAVRMIRMPEKILFEDGMEAAPLAVYFTMSDDGSTALIVDVKQIPSSGVHVASGTLTAAIEAARLAELDAI